MAENPNCSACNGILYLKYQKESIDGIEYIKFIPVQTAANGNYCPSLLRNI